MDWKECTTAKEELLPTWQREILVSQTAGATMKTDDLIALLADGGAGVDRAAERRRFLLPLAAALVICLATTWAFLGLRPDWHEAIALPMFWLKLEFTAAACIAAALLLRRSGQPGRRTGLALAVVVFPFALVWLVALVVLWDAPAAARASLVMGETWRQCLASVAALSAPAIALSFVAIRSLTPTRLALAGAAAGLVAGGMAGFAYALHCVEMQAPFLAVWYALGMLLPALVGALMGPRLLRW